MERYDQKRTSDMISKIGTSDRQDHREVAKVVRTC